MQKPCYMYAALHCPTSVDDLLLLRILNTLVSHKAKLIYVFGKVAETVFGGWRVDLTGCLGYG